MTVGLRLRHLAFTGPHKPVADLDFGPGLNVLYGASDTGKSFVVNTIDFMLGGRGPLEDLQEREGYDRIFLGVENLRDGETYTIHRSVSGGAFIVYHGLHKGIPESPGCELSDHHNERQDDNLSRFILGLLDLTGQRLRKNKAGDTVSLSIRNLARLVIVNEEEIIQKRSPLSDGNVVADTPNTATFKLLITGVDDSSLSSSAKNPADVSRQAQIELLTQLIAEQQRKIRKLSGPPKELEEQYEKVDDSLRIQEEQLSSTETQFREASSSRRALRKRWEESTERMIEIEVLQERFTLLDAHYNSDVSRLQGIAEAGTLFLTLETQSCPLCGADPSHQHLDSDCMGNTELVVDAARAEIEKINKLQTELSETLRELASEKASLAKSIPRLETQLKQTSEVIEQQIAPNLRVLRSTYSQLSDKKSEIRESLALFDNLQSLEVRKGLLEAEVQKQPGGSSIESELPASATDQFAALVLEILKDWHFPNVQRVHFERSTRDLVINGKNRTSFGKGLRAITQSAFTIGLLEFCRRNARPHPGFVVLDSPLLSYKEPEGTEDDLRDTDLKVRFYSYLHKMPPDRQVIVVENTDPPADIQVLTFSYKFTGIPGTGRPGLFPV